MMDASGWSTWLVVAAGSALGGVLRYGTAEMVTRWTGAAFPWGTLAVNVLGSLLIGVFTALATAAGPGTWGPLQRHAAMTGLLGGFTTFSTFSAQTLLLLQQGQWSAAALNAALSVGLGVAACGAGYTLASGAVR